MTQVLLDGAVHRLPSSAVESGRSARLALADIVDRIGPLHDRVLFIKARARNLRSASERRDLLEECEDVEATIRIARTELIVRFMDAPRAVASHSRVVDVGKAIDSLERGLAEARRALRGD